MKVSKKLIGQRLKVAIEESGMTQVVLAKTTGLPESTLSAIKNGDRYPTPDKLAVLSAALGVSIDWIVTGDDSGKKQPPPTKEDALRLLITSDPALIEAIKDDLRNQVREEERKYTSLDDHDEKRLLKAFRLLDHDDKETIIKTAEKFSVALSRGLDQGQEAGDCAVSNDK